MKTPVPIMAPPAVRFNARIAMGERNHCEDAPARTAKMPIATLLTTKTTDRMIATSNALKGVNVQDQWHKTRVKKDGLRISKGDHGAHSELPCRADSLDNHPGVVSTASSPHAVAEEDKIARPSIFDHCEKPGIGLGDRNEACQCDAD